MTVKVLDPKALAHFEDWVGNSAAFTCPICSKVFLVSVYLHKGKRQCPSCGKSIGVVTGGKKSGGSAYVRWELGSQIIYL